MAIEVPHKIEMGRSKYSWTGKVLHVCDPKVRRELPTPSGITEGWCYCGICQEWWCGVQIFANGDPHE